jgi:ATP-binding cassette subfamily B protein
MDRSAALRAYHEENPLGKAYDLTLLRRLWPFLRPHARYALISLIALLAGAAVSLMRPLVMGKVVDAAAGGDPARLIRYGALLGGLVVLSQAISFGQMYSMQIAGARAMAGLRRAVFVFLQRLSLAYYDRTPVGRLVTRATNDVDAVGELFGSGVFNALGDLIQLGAIVVMMLVLDAQLSLIAFVSLPVVATIVQLVRRRARGAFRDIRAWTARLNAFLNEQVSGVAVVQAFSREAAMAVDFDEVNVAYREANKRSIYYDSVLDAAIEMVSTLCIASVLYWTSRARAIGHPTSFALVVTFAQYIKQFFEPVNLLSQRYTILQNAMSGAERIFQLFDLTEFDAPAGPRPIEAGTPALSELALELERVSFEYKAGTPVLKDVSLSARAGEKIALVGATGAGKTTIASLVQRLYDATTGTVRVLGRDVRVWDREALRRSFAVVPQDVFLFSGTLLANVALGEAVPDRARVKDALSRVGALELFAHRAGGLDARVDERGANFSAGERQLIAFARALYRDSPILILDEATASVDSHTEAALQRALAEVMRGRTALVIAHRLSTIQAADRIVVFHKGQVVELGTHKELLERDGVYARLHRLQFARERLEEQDRGQGVASASS